MSPDTILSIAIGVLVVAVLIGALLVTSEHHEQRELRSMLILIAAYFLLEDGTNSEHVIQSEDLPSIPKGKAVRITVEYVDAGEFCDGGTQP